MIQKSSKEENWKDNITDKERIGIRSIKGRKNIVI